MDAGQVERQAEGFRESFERVRAEIGRAIVGQHDIVEHVLVALVVGGHVLLEGVPGLGKTFLVRTLSDVLDARFSRIQFTPDLMPADIVGTNLIVETPAGGREFRFQPGPVFANIVLADEINRATPKTQSALLEAMQEASVTAGGEIRPLPQPFFVLATQNPIEMEGTYPLPEAQLDRFLFKLNVSYPGLDDLAVIMNRTTGAALPQVGKVMDAAGVLRLREFARQAAIAPEVQSYALRLVLATHPGLAGVPPRVAKYVRYGASPRGAQAIVLVAKAAGLLDGRLHASFDDVARAVRPALRHRIILNFEGEADGVTPDDMLADILEATPQTAD